MLIRMSHLSPIKFLVLPIVDLVSVSSFCVWFVALATSLGRVQTLTDEFVENFGDANVVQNVALPGANQELVKSQNNRFFFLLGNDQIEIVAMSRAVVDLILLGIDF